MKKIVIAGIVILVILIVVPFVINLGSDKITNIDVNEYPLPTTQTNTTGTTTSMQKAPTTSAAAIDAFLGASANLPDENSVNDGSYDSLNQ